MTTTPSSNSAPPLAAILSVLFSILTLGGEKHDLSPQPEEQQVPRAMHSQMKDRPRVTVGLRNADIIGADNRALQGAVDYIAGLGGGVVEVGEGEFLMRDSLHLRSFVALRGTKGK